MKRILIFLMFVFFLFDLPYSAIAGVSASQSFQMSVTIPAIVGVNVFEKTPTLSQNISKIDQMITTEELNINGEKTLVQTIVLK